MSVPKDRGTGAPHEAEKLAGSRVVRLLAATPLLRFPPGDQAVVRRWSAEVRAAVQRLALPEQLSLEATPQPGLPSDNAVVATGVRRVALNLGRGDGSSFPAALLRPEDDAPRPAVVAVDLGAEAVELAAAGIAVVALSTLDLSDDAVTPALLLTGRSPLAVWVDDALAVRRWFQDQPGVTGPIGFVGAGAGAAVALHAALIAGDGAPVALSGPVGGYAGMIQRGVPALPGILRYADLPDLVAALVPRPLLVRSARGSMENGGTAVQDAYKAFGAEEHLETEASMVHFLTRRLSEPAPVPPVPPLRVLFGIEARLEVADRIDQVLASGMLTQGRLVTEFEALSRQFTGAESVAVASGTAALDIAYQLIDVRHKTVLAPVNTFFATAASIVRMGGHVDFVDIELDGFGMDPQALRTALSRHDAVAAVVVVHIAGVVSPSVQEILTECAARGIPVIEDTAHALGSTFGGRLAGSMGSMGTFSLHPAKVATSGEGGLFVARDPAHLDSARKLRDHGKIAVDKNIHDRLGNNWRLSEVHAAVGLAHFARLDAMLAMRRELAAWYDEHISSVPRVTRYVVPSGSQSNYYKYVAFLDPAVDRAELKIRLRQRHGVSLAGEVYDILLSEQPYFASEFEGRGFEQAKWFTKHHICLPAFPSMTRAEQRHVLQALRTELS